MEIHDEDDGSMLEADDQEQRQHFFEFWDDVYPEFEKFGHVVELKVCKNIQPHLKGNVYVQYEKYTAAANAQRAFSGRFYAGRMLTCRFTPRKLC